MSTFVVGHLPQGAPTSPMLANLVCAQLDADLHRIAVREGLIYTRYADDMTFSGEFADRTTQSRLVREVSRVVGEQGFGVNSQKTSFTKNGSRKIVTGLSVDGSTLRIPRSYKDAIRQELHFLERFGLSNHCARVNINNHLSYLLRLAGRIRYVAAIEPILGRRLKQKFKRLFPDFSEIESLIRAT